MRLGTLFSGIGAPEQAAARVWPKHDVVFACELDKYARQSYLANYAIDEAHFHTDVKELDGAQYKNKVDVLIGGSPCQAFSIAGMRGGTDDERGQLIYQYVRIVDEVKAPVIVYENVKGILSIDGGRTIKEFVEALREIGYYCHYGVLNTKDYGVPQNRERFFLVGFLDHEVYYRFEFAPKIPLIKRLKDVLESSVDEKYYLGQTAIKGFEAHAKRTKEQGNGFKLDPARGDMATSSITTITTRAGSRSDDNFVKIAGKLDIKGNDHIRRVYDCFGISPCLTTMQGGNQEPKIIELTEPMIYDDYNGNLKTDGIACALTTNCGSSARRNGQKVVELKIIQRPRGKNKGGKHEVCPTISSHSFEHNNLVFEPKIVAMRGRYSEGGKIIQKLEYNGIDMSNALTTVQKCNLVDDAHRIRKLTSLECWRLQDFPDKAHEKAKKAGVSDTQLYKQAGNSMTVAVVESIFRQIDKALKGEYCAGQGSLF